MKNTFLLTFALILLAGSPLKAQEKEEAATLNKVVNTLKERITLAGYAQLGYTYDDKNFCTINAIPIPKTAMRICTLPCGGHYS